MPLLTLHPEPKPYIIGGALRKLERRQPRMQLVAAAVVSAAARGVVRRGLLGRQRQNRAHLSPRDERQRMGRGNLTVTR